MATKRKQVSLGVKLKMIKEHEDGQSVKKLSNTYGLAQSTVSTILSGRASIKKMVEDGVDMDRKRGYRHNVELDKRILSWFRHHRAGNVQINGPIIKEKALEIAREMGIDDFSASNGWFDLFKKRHYLELKALQGEENVDSDSSDSDSASVEELTPTVTYTDAVKSYFILEKFMIYHGYDEAYKHLEPVQDDLLAIRFSLNSDKKTDLFSSVKH